MNRVYMMADIHGRKNPIRDFYNRMTAAGKQPTEKDVMILLGDTAANFFFDYRDRNLKRDLKAYSMTYFLIRGNHEQRPEIVAAENPDAWHKEMFWGNEVWVENEFPYIKYALDQAAIYNIPYIERYCEGTEENPFCEEHCPIYNFYKTLVIPGGYSVDKYFRLQNKLTWFEEEQLSPREREDCLRLIEQNPKVDIILSHTAPCILEPTDLFLSVVDQSMVDKSTERLLGEVEYLVDYKAFFWGHYHKFRDYPRTDGKKKLMLFNDAAINLVDYMKKEEVERL